MIVDAGNTGYGIGDVDSALMFIDENNTAGHVVISRQFVQNRGW